MEDLPAGWTAHTAPTGHTYYYNASTKKSTYKRPAKAQDLAEQSHAASTSVPSQANPATEQSTKDSPAASLQSSKPTTDIKNQTSDGDRPKHKVLLDTAPGWLIVHTKKGRTFYHNTLSSESFWTVPDILAGPLREWQHQQEDLDDDVHTEQEPEDDEEYSEYPTESAPAENVEFDEDDIAWQLAALEEAGEGMEEPQFDGQPEFTLAEKMGIFKKMLEDLSIDPFGTWVSQVYGLVGDPRYLILDNTHHRKTAFEEYCTEKAHEIQVRKDATEKEDPKTAYVRLVKSSPSLLYFRDFKRKHKKDEAFRNYGNSDHEREKLFRECQSQKS